MAKRTPEEDSARGKCREIVRAEGSYIRKTKDRQYIIVGECDRWPEGVYLPFHGWCDAHNKLRELIETPTEKVV